MVHEPTVAVDGTSDGRGNGINDTLSLSSFSNKKNGSCSEPIYQQNQRVQVYYPASIYGDSTNGGRATLVRTSSATRNGQESSPIHCDYGFTPSMVPSTRVIRAKSSLNCHREDRHHLYDVPHRYLRKDGGQQQFLIQSATTTCNTVSNPIGCGHFCGNDLLIVSLFSRPVRIVTMSLAIHSVQ